MIDHLCPVSTTNQRQHDTLWTLWWFNTKVGETYASEEAVKAAASSVGGAACIVEPKYRSE